MKSSHLLLKWLQVAAAISGLWAASSAALAQSAPTGNAAEAAAFYEQHIRPLLAQRCYACHSGRAAKPQGGLLLDTQAGWMQGGGSGPAVTPGKPDASLLITAVRYTNRQLEMPPDGKLPDRDIALLTKWIAMGAPGGQGGAAAVPAPRHWAFEPIHHVTPPKVQTPGWSRTPVDQFILAALEKKGLKPSPPADRRTLIRRATYDLTGLPPTPEEIDAFLHDRSPNAYEKVVDRLLASPAYGERWARHWLDVAHYGDTHGYDKDKRRDHAWPYRDYVIRAFNDDKPYTRFVREQIAGDVLFPNSPEGIIATGFIAAGPWDFVGNVELEEGTVEKEKTRLLDRDDMVASTISTFCSVTIHCARCHNHKFDPIPQRDYYRLQAVFSGVERGDRPYADGPVMERKAALDRHEAELLDRRAALQNAISRLSSPDLIRYDREIAQLKSEIAALPVPAGDKPSPTNGYHSEISDRQDAQKWVQVDLGKPMPIDEIRLIPARPTDFADTPGFGFPVRFHVAVSNEPGFMQPEVIADHRAADYPSPGDSPVVLQAGGKTARYVRITADRLWPRTNDYVFALAEVQVLSGGHNVAQGTAVTALDSIEAGRWNRAALVDGFDSRRSLPDPANLESERLVRQRATLQQQLQTAQAGRQAVQDALIDVPTREEMQQIEQDLKQIAIDRKSLPQFQLAYSVLTRTPRPIHVLARGEVLQPKELVGPGALSCVPGLESDFKVPAYAGEGAGRVALADWITSPKNMLTWRSIVNRVWHYHFGRGIVDTPNDFGRNGSRPSHPELLDWLATYFLNHGQSFKQLDRLLLTSAVYQQASEPSHGFSGQHTAHVVPHGGEQPGNQPHAGGASPFRTAIHGRGSAPGNSPPPDPLRIDADNRLLWRMSRQRLDAEEVRDTILAVSGNLDQRMYGPGFEQFRFKDDHSPIYDYTAPDKVNAPDCWRRSIYRFTVRSVPNPFMESLDAADPNTNTPVRNTTLTALQSLALMNDPFVVFEANRFAERIEKQASDPERQVDLAYRLALGHAPRPDDRAQLIDYVRKHGLANACRLLFNTNEFVFVD
jgi:hypothetical protein